MGMATPSAAVGVFKLGIAGEHARFPLKQMIELLNGSVTVENLLRLIERKLTRAPIERTQLRPSRWVM
jgi:hypothetical protein